jgi:hypothetical protein
LVLGVATVLVLNFTTQQLNLEFSQLLLFPAQSLLPFVEPPRSHERNERHDDGQDGHDERESFEQRQDEMPIS